MTNGAESRSGKDEQVFDHRTKAGHAAQIAVEDEHEQEGRAGRGQHRKHEPARAISPGNVTLRRQEPGENQQDADRCCRVESKIEPKEDRHACQKAGANEPAQLVAVHVDKPQQQRGKATEQRRENRIAIESCGGQQYCGSQVGRQCPAPRAQHTCRHQVDDQGQQDADQRIVDALDQHILAGNAKERGQHIGLAGRIDGPVVAQRDVAVQDAHAANQRQPLVVWVQRCLDGECDQHGAGGQQSTDKGAGHDLATSAACVCRLCLALDDLPRPAIDTQAHGKDQDAEQIYGTGDHFQRQSYTLRYGENQRQDPDNACKTHPNLPARHAIAVIRFGDDDQGKQQYDQHHNADLVEEVHAVAIQRREDHRHLEHVTNGKGNYQPNQKREEPQPVRGDIGAYGWVDQILPCARPGET